MPAAEHRLDPASTEVLLATARSQLSADDRARVRRAIAAMTDWTACVTAALAHGTAGMLCHHLLAAGRDLLPEAMVDAAASFIAFQQQEHKKIVGELAGLVDAMTAACVRVLPYKGPVLAALCYAEPSIRGCRDLDFLIDEADIAPTMAVLARLGFRSLQQGLTPRQIRAYYAYNGQDVLIADGRAPVEPHWRISPRTLHADIEIAPLFQRAQTIVLGGRDVASPSPEDTLLLCGLHGSKEEWSRLVWISDIAEQLRKGDGLDWASTLARADRAGARRMLLIGIALAQRALDAPVAAEIARALAADPVAERLASEAFARLFARGGRTPSVYQLTAFRVRMRERAIDRARYIVATLLTARVQHFRFVRLPTGLTFLYPLVRLGHDFVALPLWRLVRPGRPGVR